MKLPNKKRELAAQLLAEDRLPDVKIADKVGITERALAKWKNQEPFAARVTELTEAYAERVLKFGLARRERRIADLSEVYQGIWDVIQARKSDPELQLAPGHETGLITKTVKGLGKIMFFEVDVPLIRELRSTQEQIAKELGQWSEKQDVRNRITVDGESLTEEQMDSRIEELLRRRSVGQ